MSIATVITFIAAALVAFVISEQITKWLIPLLHRLKFGQTIRDEGPAWHKSKQGTPTMGGIGFIFAFVMTALLALLAVQLFFPETQRIFHTGVGAAYTVKLVGGFLMALLYAAIGFLDDYIKVVKKRNLGLTSRQKLLAQILIAAIYTVTVYVCGGTDIYVPFVGLWEAGFWYIPIGMFIIVAIVNATNLTDGVDGLCATVSTVVCLLFLVLCGKSLGYGILSSAMAGALAGFLVWNLHPAKVFMGDTGSLFIGGVLCALCFGIGHPFLLLPMGFVYFSETLSVVLQVSYFKLTHGKRLFKMTPIHHHFEMSGWSENKIVCVFSLVAALGSVIGIAIVLL